MGRINDWYTIPVAPMLLMSSNRGGQLPLQEVTTNTNSTFHLEGRWSRLHPSPTASRVVGITQVALKVFQGLTLAIEMISQLEATHT